MRTARFPFIAVLFFIFCFLSPVYACDVTDDTGQIIHLDHPARRVIALSPDLTETVFAIGGGSQLIGVIHGSDYPLAAKRITQVGAYSGLDLERIAALQPDLIVTWGAYFSRQLNVFKKSEVPIYVSNPRHIEDVPRLMRQLGCLLGTEKSAEKSARKFEARIHQLRQQYGQRKPLRVFYQIGFPALITINHDSWINEVITLCGGRNVFSDARMIAPEVGWEAVIQADPQVVLSDASESDWKKNWQKWSSISAVKTQSLYRVDPDWLERAGPRLADGAAQVCKRIAGRDVPRLYQAILPK